MRPGHEAPDDHLQPLHAPTTPHASMRPGHEAPDDVKAFEKYAKAPKLQ